MSFLLFLKEKTVSICFGCGNQINDQFILRVAPDLEWHAKCLKCVECDRFLDESCTCFVRNGKTYCKLDYIKLFSKKCFKCKESFNKNDFVMRASSNRIYHVDCFRCVMCNKQFAPGDEYALKDDGILCKTDNEIYEKQQIIPQQQPVAPLPPSQSMYQSPSQPLTCQNITNLPPPNSINSPLTVGKLAKCEDYSSTIGHNDYEDNQNCLSPAFGPPQSHMPIGSLQNPPSQLMSPHLTTLSSPVMMNSLHHPIPNGHVMSTSNHHHSNNHRMNIRAEAPDNTISTSGSSSSGGSRSSGHHGRKDKTTRVRTVLNEKQLHTLRTCYGANPRPDALMKEQLVEMTGLSPRVIRVWFQNKRCKDKKKTILIKQLQEQQKNRQTIGNGIPMIASSPVRNDISNLGPGSQIEMQSTSNAYQASSVQWMNGNGSSYDPSMHHHHHLGGSSGGQMNYENTLIGYSGSDEEDFDQLSDPNGDDSSDDDDTRIQQL